MNEGKDTMSEVEIVPLTDDQVAAIKELRFAWTNMGRTIAWGLTTSREVALRCPGGMTPVVKSRDQKTGEKVMEYDVMMPHPHAVELVVEIQNQLPAERHQGIGVAT
jgi:hypothetical protein